MGAAAESGKNPVSKNRRFSLSIEMRVTRDGTAEPIPRDQILWRERGPEAVQLTTSKTGLATLPG